MKRTFDAKRFTEVVRHPAVEPFVSLGQEIPDLAPYVESQDNYCFMNEHGGFLLVRSGDEQYDVHTAFVPEGRGPHLIQSAIDVRDLMFQEFGAVRLRTFVSLDNWPAKRLALLAGFKVTGEASVFDVCGEIMTVERKDVCQ